MTTRAGDLSARVFSLCKTGANCTSRVLLSEVDTLAGNTPPTGPQTIRPKYGGKARHLLICPGDSERDRFAPKGSQIAIE